MLECFYIQELMQFVGDKLAYMYQLHGSCRILSLIMVSFKKTARPSRFLFGSGNF